MSKTKLSEETKKAVKEADEIREKLAPSKKVAPKKATTHTTTVKEDK